jgi:DNA-binding CsgD family transcriptional regulator
VRDTLEAARAAYRRRDWQAARDGFATVEAADGLGAQDTFELADAAWWLGRVEESLAAGERAYRRYLEGDHAAGAALAAIHIGIDLLLRGDDVIGSGWIRRAQRLLDDEPEGEAHGYLTYLVEVEGQLGGPDLDAVAASAEQVGRIGREHDVADLVALGILGQGRARVKQGRTEEGLALLDEAMVLVLTEDLGPAWAGNIYCHLMAACHELGDVRRAAAWTGATTRWLATLPAAVLFTGICRVHRSQVLQASGRWDEAQREAARVCVDLDHLHLATAAEAHYQVGELRRLRGDAPGAEAAYDEARRRGRDPQPGLALLQLAGGQTGVALAGITAALAGVEDPFTRIRLRAAQVDIALTAGDLDLAEEAGDEVVAIADRFDSPGFVAIADAVQGTVRLARGEVEAALGSLRAACQRWRELGVPYEAARIGVHLARACQALGDHDGAARELDAVAKVFDQLGAAVDRRAMAELGGETLGDGDLTPREVEVLRHVAAGRTNRAIAERLVISEKTVARHLSNIFVKLGCSSRTEAAAHAFERGLAPRSRG